MKREITLNRLLAFAAAVAAVGTVRNKIGRSGIIINHPISRGGAGPLSRIRLIP